MDYSKAKILIVDDNQLFINLFRTVFKKKMDNIVTTVNNPKEMFDILDKDPDYDLIILDLEMPIMDGLTALRHLRSNEQTKDMHVIPCSAIQKTELVIELYNLGIDDYIVKSNDINIVLEKVKKVLDKIDK
jgi:CheY-like chemotaxis protein